MREGVVINMWCYFDIVCCVRDVREGRREGGKEGRNEGGVMKVAMIRWMCKRRSRRDGWIRDGRNGEGEEVRGEW